MKNMLVKSKSMFAVRHCSTKKIFQTLEILTKFEEIDVLLQDLPVNLNSVYFKEGLLDYQQYQKELLVDYENEGVDLLNTFILVDKEEEDVTLDCQNTESKSLAEKDTQDLAKKKKTKQKRGKKRLFSRKLRYIFQSLFRKGPKFFVSAKRKKRNIFFYVDKTFKYKQIRTLLQRKFLKHKKKRKIYLITVTFGANNLFCTLSNKKTNKIISKASGGILKMRVSRRSLRFLTQYIVRGFCFKIKKKMKKQSIIHIKLSCPLKSAHYVAKRLKKYLSLRGSFTVLWEVTKTKCFNGCIAKKRPRKKRKFVRALK